MKVCRMERKVERRRREGDWREKWDWMNWRWYDWRVIEEQMMISWRRESSDEGGGSREIDRSRRYVEK